MNRAEKEKLRHLALEALAIRYPTARPLNKLRRWCADEADFEISDEEMNAALAFLKELGHAELIPDEFGSTPYWKATASGLRTWERSSRPSQPGHD